jgi:energy-converting hydrogenase Eha subunit C
MKEKVKKFALFVLWTLIALVVINAIESFLPAAITAALRDPVGTIKAKISPPAAS